MRENQPVNNCREKKSESIPLLKNAGEKSARFRRQRLHRERCAESPFATHADAKQRAKDQEHGEIGRESGEQFDHRIEDDVDHQRDPASESIAQESEEQCTHWAHHEGEHAGEGDFRNCSPEFLPDRREDEGEQKKIERVERPAKETGDERVPLISRQRLEKPERFHLRRI